MNTRDEPSLFEVDHYSGTWRPTAPHSGVDTSKAAAESVRVSISKRDRQVMRMLRTSNATGLTNEEIALRSSEFGESLLLQSVCPITNRLAKRGFIFDSQQRRPGRSRRPARVWRLSMIGKEEI